MLTFPSICPTCSNAKCGLSAVIIATEQRDSAPAVRSAHGDARATTNEIAYRKFGPARSTKRIVNCRGLGRPHWLLRRARTKRFDPSAVSTPEGERLPHSPGSAVRSSFQPMPGRRDPLTATDQYRLHRRKSQPFLRPPPGFSRFRLLCSIARAKWPRLKYNAPFGLQTARLSFEQPPLGYLDADVPNKRGKATSRLPLACTHSTGRSAAMRGPKLLPVGMRSGSPA